MKKLIVTLCAILAAFSLSAADATVRIKGSGVERSEVRKVDDFTSIAVSSAIDLYIEQGSRFKVEVTADEKVIEYVSTAVKGDRLTIGYKESISFDGRNKVQTKVRITLPDLEGVSASSASDVYLKSNLKVKSLSLKGSSAADFKFGENVVRCDDLEIALSSSSDFDGGVFRCGGVAEIKCSSASDVDTYIEAAYCKAQASSASDITVLGSADKVKAAASSGAEIDFSELEGKDVVAAASSGASITVNATQILDASASSGADIRYFGKPKEISRSSSSGGSVKAK